MWEFLTYVKFNTTTQFSVEMPVLICWYDGVIRMRVGIQLKR